MKRKTEDAEGKGKSEHHAHEQVAVDDGMRRKREEQVHRQTGGKRRSSAREEMRFKPRGLSDYGADDYGHGEDDFVDAEFRNNDDDDDRLGVRVVSQKKSYTSTPSSTSSLRLLTDPRADERLALETRHCVGFLETHSTELSPSDDWGVDIHVTASNGERRIRQWTHAGCGFVRVAVMFPCVFVLTCLQCLVKYILRPIAVGVAEIAVDDVAKPLVVVVYNKFLSPVLLLMFNLLSAVGVALKPGLGILREMAVIVAKVCASIRIGNVELRGRENENKRDLDGSQRDQIQRRDYGVVREI